MFRRTLLMLTAMFALAASAVQARPVDFHFVQLTHPTVETIYGSKLDARGLTLRVGSSGCTARDSFRMTVKGSPWRPKVTAMRVRPDYCKAMFRIVEFTWSYRELGVRRGAKVRVMNPVAEG